VPAFVPEQFAQPLVSPDTASLFRRTPYISPSEYAQAPTAVAVNNLVPGGSKIEQAAALAAVISRASDEVDTICFHRADGTLAATPATESGWIRPKDNGSIYFICNYKPILEVDGMAIGLNATEMQNISQSTAETLTINGQIILLPCYNFNGFGQGGFPSISITRPTVGGKVYAVWRYVNGFPHTSLATEAAEGESEITVDPSEPGGSKVYGVYEGTQLTIHDGAATEVVVVSKVEGLTLKLLGPLQYEHKVPTPPDTVRVSAVPWVVEQATVSLTSWLIKKRGTRAMMIPSSPARSANPPKQEEGQAGASTDYRDAVQMLKPFIVPYLRST